ncbi:MAG: leucine--tRNA ligase [Cyclobacteriaceae bacterium]|nr:leucine--tRNA ligase [Cyclobacteriaceae bacterium]
MPDYSKDEIRRIEQKWQSEWERRRVYEVQADPSRPKYYVLDMFPYPSGSGLHVGHPLGYIASDIVARYKRLKGFNVLHPMGFDAFGLPAEQYAIQTGQHPAVTTAQNIETYKRQLKQIGFSYDWNREVQTCDPSFYKWTQWIFMQLFNAWYNRKEGDGKAEHIDTLIRELEKHGNTRIDAACDDDTPTVTAEEWKAMDARAREQLLQKYRIAYQSETVVNWCPALGTVLSNDEVKDGVSERGGFPVERIKMLQWSMRISAYAERLLKGLDLIDWPENVKEMQRNWIGRSTGCELDFPLDGNDDKAIRVFTTRIDTIYGVTFMVLAPEHELVESITSPERRKEVMEYVELAKNRTERERMSEVKRISGVFTGAYCINPFNNERIPVWVADYVLAGYGTGAVMAVPSSDTRDYAFAKHFNLPVVDVLEGPTSDITRPDFNPKSGTMINSDFLNGLPWEEAIEKAADRVETMGIGRRKINYRMRDAIFGRQRYWGEPFPVYYKDGIPHLVDEKDLPILLPEIDEYRPTESGEPPLARARDWKYRPAQGEEYPFEHTTMPGWAGSSWYWYRYMDPKNDKAFCGQEAEAYWRDVDLYIGGSEHATGHLLYSRFWNKALKDLGYVAAEEPFKKMINQGHIQGISQLAYRLKLTPPLDHEVFISADVVQRLEKSADTTPLVSLLRDHGVVVDPTLVTNAEYTPLHVYVGFVENDVLDIASFREWRPELKSATIIPNEKGEFRCHSEVEKMSKTKHNVVNPDDIVAKYGADTLRMYEMFLGPLEVSKPWSTHGIDGVYKFLRKFWNLFHNQNGEFNVSDAPATTEELRVLHKTIRKVADDIDRFSFNTSVSEFMICANELTALKCNKRAILEPLTIVLSPFAPHIAEELWELLGHGETILNARYPEYDEQYLTADSFEYPVSINGKVRARINLALDMPTDDIERTVLADATIQKWTQGKAPRKVIIVPGKIINVVI